MAIKLWVSKNNVSFIFFERYYLTYGNVLFLNDLPQFFSSLLRGVYDTQIFCIDSNNKRRSRGVAMSLGRSVLKLLLVCLKDKVISIVLLSLWLYPPLNTLYFVLLNLLYIFVVSVYRYEWSRDRSEKSWVTIEIIS